MGFFDRFKNKTAVKLASEVKDGKLVALSELVKRSDAGDVDAHLELGVLFATGNKDPYVPLDYTKSFHYYTKAAVEGRLPNAYYNIGIMALLGQGVTQNTTNAIDYFKIAEQGGNPRAASKIKAAKTYIALNELFEEIKKLVVDQQYINNIYNLINGMGITFGYRESIENTISFAQLINYFNQQSVEETLHTIASGDVEQIQAVMPSMIYLCNFADRESGIS